MSERVLQEIHDDDNVPEGSGYLRAKLRPYIKRLLDFCAAFALIIAIFPLAVLIIMASLATGQVPFYSHVRVGRDGHDFGCLKFRSMRRNADAALSRLLQSDPALRLEWETTRKLRNDPRITRLGRFLRATSLDELPQLINVLAGQMSLVGPRPVTRSELTDYYDAAARTAYCSVRPGLTGLWQVSGRSGIGYSSRVSLDMQYVSRPSLRTDVKILFKTINIVVNRQGAW